MKRFCTRQKRFLPEGNTAKMNPELATATTVAMNQFAAVALAIAVTAVVALVMLGVVLRRSVRPTGLTIGVSAVGMIAVLIGALLVGGSLTQLPTAAAADGAARGAGSPSIELKLTGPQLPTL